MKKHRFHVLGLAHQHVSDTVTACAYTAKVRNMCKMLMKAGQEVYLYHAGGFTSPNICTKAISVVDTATLTRVYGEQYHSTYNQGWKEDDEAWREFRRRAGLAISSRLSPNGDIVLASFGSAHKACCPPESAAMTVEMGIGYEGVFAPRKVWESHAWMHFMAGRRSDLDLSRDIVIPGYLDPEEFEFSDKKKGYFLCLGRVTPEKGIEQACAAAKAGGHNLLVVGPGDPQYVEKLGKGFPAVTFMPSVSLANRMRFLKEAQALVCFSRYIEPFGNVAIEAMISGTPVISSNMGAFTETVVEGRTGFRCSDIPQLMQAMTRIARGDSGILAKDCRDFAMNFSLDSIWPRYSDYFDYQHQIFSLENGFKFP